MKSRKQNTIIIHGVSFAAECISSKYKRKISTKCSKKKLPRTILKKSKTNIKILLGKSNRNIGGCDQDQKNYFCHLSIMNDDLLPK